jgi:N-acetylated-alpha-linked acidic dipeptidase
MRLAENLREWLKRLRRIRITSVRLMEANAEFIASQFKAWGFDTQIEEFKVLFPTPKTRLVELVAPEKFTARLAEPPPPRIQPRIKLRNSYRSITPTGGWRRDGAAGLCELRHPRDYDELAQRGIDVKGKIVIAVTAIVARHQTKVAAEHGAVGCLIILIRATTVTTR